MIKSGMGELFCAEAPEELARHCLHERQDHGDRICCHCGDLFQSEHEPSTRHGQHKPRSVKAFHRALKRLLRAQAAVDKVTDYSRFGGAATVELSKAVDAALRLLGR